eukprot:gene3584-12105_t
MTQGYFDAMAIVARHGRPDYFITMTANPAWPEIANNLAPGETADDRPDLVDRVFYLYFLELLHDLTVKGVLGRAVAWTYVIEFRAKYKPRNAVDADRVISAELPCPLAQPTLFHLVAQFMLHGPCGECNPDAPCMRDGCCKRRYSIIASPRALHPLMLYPREFQEDTEWNPNGYPKYRRRDTGRHVNKKKRAMNNRVGAYDAYLLGGLARPLPASCELLDRARRA